MLCHATRKTVSDSGDKLSDDEKEQIEAAVTSLEEAAKAENIEQIEEATKTLNDVLTPLSSKLY
jgi:molecular chaperone DnaK